MQEKTTPSFAQAVIIAVILGMVAISGSTGSPPGAKSKGCL